MQGAHDRLAHARGYLFAHGRPLDQQLYAFHFEEGSSEHVIQALAAFQNEDGGFGHALEPDLRTAASSVIATTHGLAILREVGQSSNSDMGQRAIHYLLGAVDRERHVWPIVPPAVEDAPHAPWWTYADTPATFKGFGVNPSAAVVAYLYEYGEMAPAAMVEATAAQVVDFAQQRLADLDANDLLTLLLLAGSNRTPPAVRQPMLDVLAKRLPEVVQMSEPAWESYGLQPLEAAPTPDSLGANWIPREVIERNLAYWRDTQLPDGSWPLTWQWAFVDTAAWAQAEKEWKGEQIVRRLRTLQAYRRL
jgi:hypothetical protein